jgi:hypothetical protein
VTRNTALVLKQRVAVDGECLVWAGQRQPKGYGQVSYEGRLWRTHRLAWVLANGAIPTGLHVLPRCDNPPCLRLDHIYLGTNADNVRDRESRGRRRPPVGTLNASARLTEGDVADIRAAAAAGRLHHEIARKYGVTRAAISHVIQGRTWRHV